MDCVRALGWISLLLGYLLALLLCIVSQEAAWILFFVLGVPKMFAYVESFFKR